MHVHVRPIMLVPIVRTVSYNIYSLYYSMCLLFLDINMCLDQPCQNDGVCANGVNEYTCIISLLQIFVLIFHFW